MKTLEEQFKELNWPQEFVVQFNNGNEQIFVSEKGVHWDNGENLEGKDENRANISCAWKKKSPSQQKHKMIEFFVDEVKQFKTVSGDTIWEPGA
jgi:hypothetical protein